MQTERPDVDAGTAPVIDDKQVFTVPQLRALLQLNETTLDRLIRRRVLRCARIAGKRYVVGAWVHQMLEARADQGGAGRRRIAARNGVRED
jgi:hypothetical protein